jgi:hypothetical protein
MHCSEVYVCRKASSWELDFEKGAESPYYHMEKCVTIAIEYGVGWV